ncbi:hypothetical protein [Kitasatospora sp. NPDC004272]
MVEVGGEGGDQHRAGEAGVEQDAEGDREADPGEARDGEGAEDGEGRGQDRERLVLALDVEDVREGGRRTR